MADSETLQVLFQTTADSAGAKQIVADLNQVKTAAKDAGQAAKEAGDQMEAGNNRGGTSVRELLKGMKSAHFASKDFGELLKGDFSNATGIAATGLKAINAAAMAGPWGILLGAITLLIPVVLKFTSAANDAQRATGEIGDGSESMASKVKTSVESGIKEYEALAKAIVEARKAQDEMADAQTQQKLAKVDQAEANLDISPDEAKQQRADIRAQGEQDKIDRERKVIAKENENAQGLLDAFKTRQQTFDELRTANDQAQAAADSFYAATGQRNAKLDQTAANTQEAFDNFQPPNEQERDDAQKEIARNNAQDEVLKIKSGTGQIKQDTENTKLGDERREHAQQDSEQVEKRTEKEKGDSAREQQEEERKNKELKKKLLEQKREAIENQIKRLKLQIDASGSSGASSQGMEKQIGDLEGDKVRASSEIKAVDGPLTVDDLNARDLDIEEKTHQAAEKISQMARQDKKDQEQNDPADPKGTKPKKHHKHGIEMEPIDGSAKPSAADKAAAATGSPSGTKWQKAFEHHDELPKMDPHADSMDAAHKQAGTAAKQGGQAAQQAASDIAAGMQTFADAMTGLSAKVAAIATQVGGIKSDAT